MSAPVFVVDHDQVSADAAGGTVRLAGDEGRHASVVQRLTVGEEVELVDGQGTRARCVIMAVGKGWLDCRVDELVQEPPEPIRVTLVQALAKSDRSELAIQAATELGVMAVVPWQAQRSIVQWRGDRAAKSHEKWQQAVLAASKQARRAWHPQVQPLVTTTSLTESIAQACQAQDTVLVLHESAPTGLSETVAPAGDPGEERRVWLVVGPEGGISDDEVHRFTQAGAKAVRLGPHVLRTSTAGPAAIAALQMLWGGWK